MKEAALTWNIKLMNFRINQVPLVIEEKNFVRFLIVLFREIFYSSY